jgi:TetR/AcrR family transcriptional regulator
VNALRTDTEQKIIQAAHAVFLEKGMQGARMQEIADRAGINKALLHYYFRSKDKLFDAVFEETVATIIPQFAMKLNSASSPIEIMMNFFNFYNTIFRENPHLPQFFFHEIWQHPEKLEVMIKSQHFNPKELLGQVAEQMPKIDDSEFFPQHMIANVMGMCLFPHISRPLFQRLFFDNNDIQYNKFLEERTDILLKTIGGIAPALNLTQISNPDEDF